MRNPTIRDVPILGSPETEPVRLAADSPALLRKLADAQRKLDEYTKKLDALQQEDEEENKPLPSLADDIRKLKAMKDAVAAEERRVSERMQNQGPLTEADERAMRDMQGRCDSVYQELGRRAPEYLPGERPGEYRRRLLKPLMRYSGEWANVKLDTVTDPTLDIVEPAVLEAARAEAMNPRDLPPGTLREVRKQGETGHIESSFYGAPGTHFVQQFTRPPRRVKSIKADGWGTMVYRT